MTEGRLPEALGNRLLRRVDWRFLLAQEELPKAVSFAGNADIDRALELVAVAVPPDARTADLAVLVDPRAEALRAAWDSLRAGGSVYVEWRRPALGGLTRRRRKLAAIGFTAIRCYWPGPWPWRQPQFWLPLEAPNALAFFLRSRAGDPRRRRRATLTVLWRLAARLGVLTPLCCIARKPASGITRPDEQTDWLLLTGGRRSINKVVALGFRRDATVPDVAVKLARSLDEDEPLRREAAVLEGLERTRPELPGVPRVVFVRRRCGRVAVGQSVVGGRPLQLCLDRGTFPAHAEQVTTWLGDLAVASAHQPADDWRPRLVDGPLAELGRLFAGAIEPTELEHAREVLSTVDELPLVCEHRDCSPWNVLIDEGGELSLVDWESAEPRGLPGLDLAYFLSYAAFFLDGGLEPEAARSAYARSLDPATFTGSVVRACEQAYCRQVGMPETQLGPLRLLCWTVHARSDVRHFALEEAAAPRPVQLRQSMFLELWRAELRRQ